MANSPSVLIVEDHSVLSHSLRAALMGAGIDLVEIADASTLDDEGVLDAARKFRPDVVLLDLHLGGDRLAVPLIKPLGELNARVLILTASSQRALLAECIEAGAAGLFEKARSFDQLVETLHDAATGRTVLAAWAREELLAELRDQRRDASALRASFSRLTPAESEVLGAIVDGKAVGEIAADKVVAQSTVRSQVQSILLKLGVNSQLAAAALARRAGWPGLA